MMDFTKLEILAYLHQKTHKNLYQLEAKRKLELPACLMMFFDDHTGQILAFYIYRDYKSIVFPDWC